MTTYYRHKRHLNIIAKIVDGVYYDAFTYQGVWDRGLQININEFYVISENEAFELIITKYGHE